MAKRCLGCGNVYENNVNFCATCGSQNFQNLDSSQVAGVQNPQQQYNYQQPVSQQQFNYQQPVQQYVEPKKKKNVGLIVGIIAGVLILLGIIGALAQNDLEEPEIPDIDIMDSVVPDIEYTKGEVIDGYYINEWANIKFEITEDYPDNTEELRSMQENAITDCGFASGNLTDGSGRLFSIAFENLGWQANNYSTEEYMNVLIDGLEEGYKEANVVYAVSETAEKTIAGETYKFISIDVGNGMLCQQICVRQIDEYMVVITVSNTDKTEVENAWSLIQAVE